jgi:hypothetical protein
MALHSACLPAWLFVKPLPTTRLLRMPASACQLVPYAFVRFPSSERSSAKSPCRQVNESFGSIKSLIVWGKIPNWRHRRRMRGSGCPAARVVNSLVQKHI